MAAQGTDDFGSLTRRHAVKVDTVASVEDCILAIGEVIGHKNVLAASRMSNAVVCFLNTVENADVVAERGIAICGMFTSVFPLSTRANQVMLSNVPPFIRDEVLVRELSRFGKVVAPVKKIVFRSKSELLKHVVSFRRFTYMILNDSKAELNLSVKFRIQDFDYTVYVSTDIMKCFGCGKIGHLIRACPENKDISVKQVAVEKTRSKIKIKQLVLLSLCPLLVKMMLGDKQRECYVNRQLRQFLTRQRTQMKMTMLVVTK